MNKLITKLCFIYVFLAAIFCGCSYNEKTKDKEILLQLENGETEKIESSQDICTDFSKESNDEENKHKNEIYVYVCGAVQKEGVYILDEKSRIYEVIEMAGGFTADADSTTLNLAREAVDGEQITVLTKEQAKAVSELKLQEIKNKEIVNINTATVAELTAISGIGESRAKAIITYREKNGNFKTIDDIKKVDGIKEGLFSKIKDKITV